MARKISRRVAASKRKKSPAAKGRKSPAAKRAGGAKRTARSASAGQRKVVSPESFVRSIRTLHDLGLLTSFLQFAKSAELTLTMDVAAFDRVKNSVNKLRQTAVPAGGSGGELMGMESVQPPPPAEDPFDFGSATAARGGLGRVAPLPGKDPFDF